MATCGSCRVGSRGGHENTFGFGQLETSACIDGSEIWWCDTNGAYRFQMNGAHGSHTNGAHRSHTNGVYGSRAELRFPRPPGCAVGQEEEQGWAEGHCAAQAAGAHRPRRAAPQALSL